MKKINPLYLLVVLFVFVGIPFNNAFALSLSPARIEIESDPGTTVQAKIQVLNEQSETKTFYTSFANFEAMGDGGTPNFTDDKTGLASWITTNESVITLKAGEQKIVPITITIPKNTTPGGYFAATFFGSAPNSSDTTQVSIGSKIGSLVLLRVSGDIKEAAGLSEFNTENGKKFYNTLPVNFVYKFRNDGGDRVHPNGEIKIKSFGLIRRARLNGNPVDGNILPGSTRKFTVTWEKNSMELKKDLNPVASFFQSVKYQWKNFAFGYYSANLKLAYGTKLATVSSKTSFFVFPWQLLLCILVLLFIVYKTGKTLLRKYNAHIISKANTVIKSDENETV